MSSLSTLFLILISIITIQSQTTLPTGTWQYPWQYGPATACLPDVFIINSTDSGTYTINYHYPVSVLTYCTTTPEVSSNLTQMTNTTTGTSMDVWTDAQGLQYTPNGQSMALSLPNGTTSYVYQILGTGIPQPFTFGTIGGYWNNPTTSASTTGCCVPDLIFFIPASSSVGSGSVIYSAYYITSNCSSNITNQTLSLSGSNLVSVNWVDNAADPTININFTAATPTALNLSLFDANTTCGYSYQRSYNYTPISGTWKQDWQSKVTTYPSSYSVNNTVNSTDSVSYLSSSYVQGSQYQSSYLVENLQNLYYDSTLQETFNYESGSNTLTNTDQTLLYSPTGSLFDLNDFVKLWGQPLASTDYSSCCFPFLINITANSNSTNTLAITYHFYKEYSSACGEFITEMDDYKINTVLSINTPSAVQLLWTDEIGNQISFVNTSTTAQINTIFPNQCSFTMVPSTDPDEDTSDVAVLSSLRMSNTLLGLVMGVLLMLTWV